MNPWATTIILLLARYLHIVCATLLVGGTLFYEMVVPIAIDELHEEQKLLVFARARWMFKSIVWGATIGILISGGITSWDHWQQYQHEHYYVFTNVRSQSQISAEHEIPMISRPKLWWAAHGVAGVFAVGIALALTVGRVPPSRPIRWMRLNLVILLLVIFLATATRFARLQAADRRGPPGNPASTG